jgi:hypothetical protein
LNLCNVSKLPAQSCKEHDRVNWGGGTTPHFVFSQKGGILLTLQRFNKNLWQFSTAFLLKVLDNVSSNGSGARITASSWRGSSLKGTKVANLYNCFK